MGKHVPCEIVVQFILNQNLYFKSLVYSERCLLKMMFNLSVGFLLQNPNLKKKSKEKTLSCLMIIDVTPNFITNQKLTKAEVNSTGKLWSHMMDNLQKNGLPGTILD